MGNVKEFIRINRFSNDVSVALGVISELTPGVYERDVLQVENVVEIANFIDSNLYIKKHLGKGIRLLNQFNYGTKAIEIYDYFKAQDMKDKTIEELDI